MSTSTYDKIHKMEDSVMKIQGLYTLWTMLYVTGLGCLAGDPTEGSSRNFLFAMTSLASIFPVFSGLNVIYGNKLPSTMFLTVGTVYQYFFWTLLAYYRGDIYGSHPIGVYNAVNTSAINGNQYPVVFCDQASPNIRVLVHIAIIFLSGCQGILRLDPTPLLVLRYPDIAFLSR